VGLKKVFARHYPANSMKHKAGVIIQNLHPAPLYFRLRGAPVFTELRRGKSARRADAASRRIVKRILHLNLHREWFAAVGASIPPCCRCESAISGWIFGGGLADTCMATRQPT
jgi:hypothetical protein